MTGSEATTEPAATYSERDGVGLVRLNRPAVHNAVDDAMMARLETILDDVEGRPEVRVLILTGAGERSFCAGGDLAYFAGLESREDGLAMSRRMKALMARLAGGPRPVLAAVGGDALGGGCEILTACHLRLAVASARFSFRQAAMGVVTGWGGGPRLLTLLGPGRALRLLLSADTIDAREAHRLGLVDFLAESREQLLDDAWDLARRIAANAPRPIAAFLELARVHATRGAEAADQLETELFGREWVGDHFRARVAEWSARREPRG